jgi:hypothetical protein
MRRALALAVVSIEVAGCSLFTDFASLSAGSPIEDASAIETGSSDARGDGGNDAGDRDGGDAPPDECSAPGLIGFWRMDDGSGSVVSDCSPSALPGSAISGAATWVAGHRGGALRLDGRTCIDMGPSSKLGPTDHFTVALWLSSIGFADAGVINYAVGRRKFQNLGWRFGMRGNIPSFEIGLTGTTNADVPGAAQQASHWIHFAASYEPGRMSLYVNGALANTRTNQVPQALATTTTPFRIGCTGDTPPNTSAFTNADVDDVRLYDRALSAAEILALAQ